MAPVGRAVSLHIQEFDGMGEEEEEEDEASCGEEKTCSDSCTAARQSVSTSNLFQGTNLMYKLG